MHLHLLNRISLLLTLTLTTTVTPVPLPNPLDLSPQGSKHNLYLATCTRRPGIGECPVLILCPPAASISYTAIAYFANGPIQPGRPTTSTATEIQTVSEPPQAWAGEKRTARFGARGPGGGRSSVATTSIDAGADKLKEGEIAGTAKLGTEDFACFRDGKTAFEGRDELGLERTYACVTDFWCASIEAGL